METKTVTPQSLLQMVQATEPEDPALITRAKAIIDADESIPPEFRHLIDRTLSTELSPTTAARKLIGMYEEGGSIYKLGGIGNAYLKVLRSGVSFLRTGGAGRPSTEKGVAKCILSLHYLSRILH